MKRFCGGFPTRSKSLDPTPREFRELMQQWCGRLDIGFESDAVEYLLARHYREAGRPLRYCQPRDLVRQVLAFCEFHDLPPVLTPKAFDVAVKNYFPGPHSP